MAPGRQCKFHAFLTPSATHKLLRIYSSLFSILIITNLQPVIEVYDNCIYM